MSWKFGYARVSTGGQDLGLQRDALVKAGCSEENIFEEKASGAVRDRVVLADVMSRLRKGDTLMVWKFDRLARSALHLIQIAEDLKARGAHLVSITDKIDTSTPMGEAMFQICGVMAQLERRLIEERREAGLAKAKAAGVKFGRKSAADPSAKTDKSGRLAKALLAVAEGQSIKSAAREHRIGEATLHRHLVAKREVSERTFDSQLSERVSERKPARNGHLNGSSGHSSILT
jgi:DNA invertase Pin-like site-specific DNA recombinase